MSLTKPIRSSRAYNVVDAHLCDDSIYNRNGIDVEDEVCLRVCLREAVLILAIGLSLQLSNIPCLHFSSTDLVQFHIVPS